MTISQLDNTYLTDLSVNDKVIEHHKSGINRVSTVYAIDDNFITVLRSDGTTVRYGTSNGMIVYPYGTTVPNFYLMQYIPASDPTPFNPGAVSADAESLIDEYGEE